ncbi:MAG: carbamoyltransferase C-terminal domain-containing protein [Candidatus Moranbacteria bacterium]|nr:carbamoyltransferase C-terminal domain-containing protein [Candidatus Moranbacteria bacterium]
MRIIGINSRYDALMNKIYSGSCALIVDGKIVYAFAEDRISKVKDDGGFDQSLKFILKKEKLTIDEIDYFYISFYGNSVIPTDKMIRHHLDLLNLNKHPEKLVVVPSHHLSHACAAYFLSPFKEAIIMVADNEGNILHPGSEKEADMGNTYCERNSYFWARGNCIALLERDFETPGEVGFGKAYNMFNEYIGFGNYLTVGKTMGLSSYGNVAGNLKKAEIWGMDKNGKLHSNMKETENLKKDVERFLKKNNIKLPKSKGEKLYELPEYKNLACFIQQQLNKWSVRKINSLIKRIGIKNICISGGVGLNGIMNEDIENRLHVPVFVPPYPSDPGQALGNAIYGYVTQTGKNNNSFIEKIIFKDYAYLGSEYSDDEILVALQKAQKKYNLKFEHVSGVAKLAAKLLAEGMIMGWFQGRSEYGARALGNRSIIADPRSIEIRDKVNVLKKRELFRPLAPSVLAEYKSEYFLGSNSLLDKYMLSVKRVVNGKRKDIKGVVHVDNTSRIQEVNKNDNEKYYNLLQNFKKITGIPMVMNTSFNMAGEPIVETPLDAIRTFSDMNLDYLICGNYIIERK